MKFLVAAALCLSVAYAAEVTTYNGDQVLRVHPKSVDHFAILKEMESAYDFWSDISAHNPVDIHVPANEVESVRDLFTKYNMQAEVFIEDIQKLVDNEAASQRKSRAGPYDIDWTSYQSHDAINQFLADIAADHPDLAEVIDIGKSGEGRTLRVIRIGSKSPEPRKKAYFMDGGIHAREWISPAITSWFVNELLTKRDEYINILHLMDFYIIPSLNPDGYEHSRTSSRLWRKTRSDHGSISGCKGVDPNRNYDDHFMGPGTSTDKCSEIYHGPTAFSEPETAAVRDFITERNATVHWIMYNAIHSYAQMILTPYGWTYDLPESYPELRAAGDRAAAALTAVHGTKYEVGSVTELLSPGAGGSDDWAFGSKFFRFSYTLEVRDTGRYGFVLPADQIIPTAEETFAAVIELAKAGIIAN